MNDLYIASAWVVFELDSTGDEPGGMDDRSAFSALAVFEGG